MTAGSAPSVAPRLLVWRGPPLWLLGWWAVGRVVVIVTAQSTAAAFRFSHADGNWYRMVARSGYVVLAGRQSDAAFFPLYPMLLRGVQALGVGWEIAGPLVSDLAFLLALWVFYELTTELFDRALARRAAIYLAIFPLGYVFSMTYPESVVLVLITAAPLCALRRRWWLAAVLAAAATLTRPEALFLMLPLAGIAWSQRRSLSTGQAGMAFAAVLAPLAGLVSYALYLDRSLHDPLAWTRAEHGWGRSFRIDGAYHALTHVSSTVAHNPWAVRDIACFFVYLGLLYAAWRLGTALAWLAAALAVVVLPLFTGTFESISRFGLLAPPLFWGLAALGSRPLVDRALRVVLLLLLVLGTLSIAYALP